MHWWVRDGGIRVDKESDAGGVCTFVKWLNRGGHVGGCVVGGWVCLQGTCEVPQFERRGVGLLGEGSAMFFLVGFRGKLYL
jgi:hypothetical protein